MDGREGRVLTSDSIRILDPNIVLSMVNMKLRDKYSSLDLLCSDLELNEEEIIERLKKIGYFYNKKENQFK